MIMKYCFICLMGISMLLSGCTTNYRAAAVEEARSYAIKKFPDLNEEAMHWIRFTSPKIQQDTIYRPKNEYSSREFAQTCFVWDIPEFDGKSLVVVGFSDKRLHDWYPVRAMFKRYRYIEATQKGDVSKQSSKKREKRSLTLPLNSKSSIK